MKEVCVCVCILCTFLYVWRREAFTSKSIELTMAIESMDNSCVKRSQANIMFPGQRSFQLNQSISDKKTIEKPSKDNTRRLKLSMYWKIIITFFFFFLHFFSRNSRCVCVGWRRIHVHHRTSMNIQAMNWKIQSKFFSAHNREPKHTHTQ